MEAADKAKIRSITPGTFSSLGSGPWASRLAKHPACCEALSNACLIFGVTPYRLSFLLGTAHPGKIYAWLSCESKPSSKYLLRLVKLHQLQLAGLDLGVVRSVDWDLGTIRYFPVLDIATGRFVESVGGLPGGIEERDVLAEWKSKTPSWV